MVLINRLGSWISALINSCYNWLCLELLESIIRLQRVYTCLGWSPSPLSVCSLPLISMSHSPLSSFSLIVMRLLCGSIIKTQVYRQEWQEDGQEADSLVAPGSQANSLHVVMALIANVFYGMMKKIKIDRPCSHLTPTPTAFKSSSAHTEKGHLTKRGQQKSNQRGVQRRVTEGGYRQKVWNTGCKKFLRIDEGFKKKRREKRGAAESLNITHISASAGYISHIQRSVMCRSSYTLCEQWSSQNWGYVHT